MTSPEVFVGSETSLRRVIDAATAGDGWAFGILYRRYATRIKAFGMSRRCDDADQLANEVMLKVFNGLGSFRGDDGRFESWVFAIARNALIDQHRASERRLPVVDVDDQFVEPASPAASAEDLVLEGIDMQRTAELLDLLTPDQREVVELRIVVGLSLEQTATHLGKPIGAVKSLQRRGLARLQRMLLSEAVSS